MKYSISRPPLFAFMCAALFVFLSAFPQAAWAKDPFAPPDGISPTSVTLAQVLADAKKADGSATPFSTSVEEGRVTAWGLKGTYRCVVSGDDYKSIVDLGVASWSAGRNAGQRWRQNENGLVILQHDIKRGGEIDAEAVGLNQKHANPDLTLLGETSGPEASFVVESHPKGGRLRWFFYDKTSHLLKRVVVPSAYRRLTYTYSDFHKTGPYTDAWQVHRSDGISQNDMDYVFTKKYNVNVIPAELAMPQSNDKLGQFPAGVNVVSLPAKRGIKRGTQIVTVQDVGGEHDFTRPGSMTSTYTYQGTTDPSILVTVTINGRGYDFILDSGAGGIFIDSDAADRLGLKRFGPTVPTQFGTQVPSYAVIPEMSVGGIKMTNVIADSLLFHYWPQTGTQVVGLLGYDFIANAVLTIDYEKGTVTATNPFLFVPPSDAVAVPAQLDDGQPFIPVQIGQASSNRFILDTGSDWCFVFPSFVQANQNELRDQGKGVDVNRILLPEAGLSDVYGYDYQLRATEVKTLTISGITLNDWLMYAFLKEFRQAGADDDGLIGADFLKYFTVYLDYPHNQIFLSPNSLMKSQHR